MAHLQADADGGVGADARSRAPRAWLYFSRTSSEGERVVQQEQIRQAVDVLARAADPVRIVLFGSQARGDPKPDSDVDFLVIERTVTDPVHRG